MPGQIHPVDFGHRLPFEKWATLGDLGEMHSEVRPRNVQMDQSRLVLDEVSRRGVEECAPAKCDDQRTSSDELPHHLGFDPTELRLFAIGEKVVGRASTLPLDLTVRVDEVPVE